MKTDNVINTNILAPAHPCMSTKSWAPWHLITILDTQFPVYLRVRLKSVGRGSQVHSGTGFKSDWCSLGGITITNLFLQGFFVWHLVYTSPIPANAQLTCNVDSNLLSPDHENLPKTKLVITFNLCFSLFCDIQVLLGNVPIMALINTSTNCATRPHQTIDWFSRLGIF